MDAHLPELQTITLSGNGFSPMDIKNLKDQFGDHLHELEDNDEDATFDDDLGDEEDVDAQEAQGIAALDQRCDEEDGNVSTFLLALPMVIFLNRDSL